MIIDNYQFTYGIVSNSIKRAVLSDRFIEKNNEIVNVVDLFLRQNKEDMISFQTIFQKKLKKRVFANKLETDRIILKYIDIEDAKNINNSVISSYENLKQWVFWAKDMCDLNKCEQWCGEAYNKFMHSEELHMVIIDKKSSKIVGVVGLLRINWNTKTCDIGYCGDIRFHGQGFVTEAVKCITKYALGDLKMKCIFLTSDEENIKSHKVADLAGYKYEKTLYGNQKNVDSKLRNTKIYSKRKV